MILLSSVAYCNDKLIILVLGISAWARLPFVKCSLSPRTCHSMLPACSFWFWAMKAASSS